MLDTGSPEYLAISPADLEGAKRNGGVGKTVSGYGSSGGSLGGRAPDMAQQQLELKSLSIGTLSLGRVAATLRESAPSLIGASVLEHFVVTLDSRSQSAYFESYRDGPYARSSFGFSLDFEDAVTVSRVWDDSPAANAGLKVGQRIASINDQAAETSCAGIRRAMQAVADSASDSITLEFNGESRTLKRTPDIP
jgi:membrane-associated protease RseP (regulator of RpoE activity)